MISSCGHGEFHCRYNACVLYPAPLRDLLMRLALTDRFRARWTEDIHEEWIRNVLVNRPDLTREQLDRTRTLMKKMFVIAWSKAIVI